MNAIEATRAIYSCEGVIGEPFAKLLGLENLLLYGT